MIKAFHLSSALCLGTVMASSCILQCEMRPDEGATQQVTVVLGVSARPWGLQLLLGNTSEQFLSQRRLWPALEPCLEQLEFEKSGWYPSLVGLPQLNPGLKDSLEVRSSIQLQRYYPVEQLSWFVFSHYLFTVKC